MLARRGMDIESGGFGDKTRIYCFGRHSSLARHPKKGGQAQASTGERMYGSYYVRKKKNWESGRVGVKKAEKLDVKDYRALCEICMSKQD